MTSAQPATAKGRETRERIILAAAELVAERGVAGTSLDDVRARAQASKSQLYHYFADRDDLMRAVARAASDEVVGGQAELFSRLDTIDARSPASSPSRTRVPASNLPMAWTAGRPRSATASSEWRPAASYTPAPTRARLRRTRWRPSRAACCSPKSGATPTSSARP